MKAAAMMRCAKLILIAVALPLSLSLAPWSPVGADTFAVPPVAYTTATIPATFISPQTPLTCLSRAEQAGSAVTTSLVCYSQGEPAIRSITTGSLSNDIALLPILPCSVAAPGLLSVYVGAIVPLSKTGGAASGWTVLVLDASQPFDCAEPVLYGPLTMTPLTASHDQDGDGCTDWNELDPAPPDHDPFNPTDCGAGGNPVGGIAELPQLHTTALAEPEDASGPGVTGIAAAAVAVALALAGAAWYGWRRRAGS